MNNLIDWKEYVDYIYCMNYMPDNRINSISSTLQNIGIDIYDNRFFSFIYDCEHKIFLDEYDLMRKKSFKFYDEHKFYASENLYCNEKYDYVFDVALTTYKILKTAQYFKYKRIIIFEDDIIFLKDLEYIKNAMDFVKTQDFDMCLCQTTFVYAWEGRKEYLVQCGCEEFDNDMFLKSNFPSGVYGGAFIILSDEGINKIVNYFEENKFITCLDSLGVLSNLIGLDILFALKPLCIQQRFIDWPHELLVCNNSNINNINEYI